MRSKFRRGKAERAESRIFVLCDLDDTLVLTREHWQKASFAAIRSMVAHGLKITAPESAVFFEEWRASEDGQAAMNAIRNQHGEVRNSEAFLYHVLLNNIYPGNENAHDHYGRLVKLVASDLTPGQKQFLVRAGKTAYDRQKAENVADGTLTAAPHAHEFLEAVKAEGAIPIVVSRGLANKQLDKLFLTGLAKHFAGLPTPILTTEPKIWPFKLRRSSLPEKTPNFFAWVKKQLGATENDFVVVVGDREASDIVPAKQHADVTVHVLTGRRNVALDKQRWAKPDAPAKSQADIQARTLKEALPGVLARIRTFKEAGK